MGFTYFAAVKYAGYSAYCRWAIEPRLHRPSGADSKVISAWKAGAVRTLIGLGIGAVVGLVFWKIPYFSNTDGLATILFFASLVPVRVFEWWLLFRWIYGVESLEESTRWKLISGGIATSFVLDGLGILAAFVLPGGIWIC